jgi:hypothetical protein
MLRPYGFPGCFGIDPSLKGWGMRPHPGQQSIALMPVGAKP